MKEDKQKQLKADFPQIFVDLFDCTPMESCMSSEHGGIACGEGWYNLIHKLCEDIMATNLPDNFKAAQVKEKFGGLMFYVDGSSNSINELIDKAERESYKICETCGSKEEVTSEGKWVRTLCNKCRYPAVE